MSQQVSLNQLLKKTEHYDKVGGIFDAGSGLWWWYGWSCCARPGDEGEEASASAGCTAGGRTGT